MGGELYERARDYASADHNIGSHDHTDTHYYIGAHHNIGIYFCPKHNCGSEHYNC
jgi:hypothetical protein